MEVQYFCGRLSSNIHTTISEHRVKYVVLFWNEHLTRVRFLSGAFGTSGTLGFDELLVSSPREKTQSTARKKVREADGGLAARRSCKHQR